MARRSNSHKEGAKTRPDPSRRPTVAEVHARTGVGKPMLVKWRRKLSEDGRNAGADPSAPSRARAVTLADNTEQLVHEAKETCHREPRMSRR